jgi:hypothetical protein
MRHSSAAKILQPPVSRRQQRNHAGFEIETGADAAFGRVQPARSVEISHKRVATFCGRVHNKIVQARSGG